MTRPSILSRKEAEEMVWHCPDCKPTALLASHAALAEHLRKMLHLCNALARVYAPGGAIRSADFSAAADALKDYDRVAPDNNAR